MSTATKTRYRLNCSCGQSVLVDRSQAGLKVACGCGALLEVPTIRGLARLEPVAIAERGRRGDWGPRQAVMFLGLVLALLGFGWGAYRQVHPPTDWTTEAEARAEIARGKAWLKRASAEQTWQFWESLQKGLDRTEPTSLIVHRAQLEQHRRWVWTLYALGGAGLVTLAAGCWLLPR